MRIWIGAGFGVGMLGLGALIPFVVPARDQTEVMVITLFLEITGAMLIWSAMNGPRPISAEPPSTRARAAGSLAGFALASAGLLLPALQTTGTADGRFLWMSAFAPMALIGAALVWRAMPEGWKERLWGNDEDAAPQGKRAPVARLGAGSAAKRVLPVALLVITAALLAAMVIALIATVLIAGLAL